MTTLEDLSRFGDKARGEVEMVWTVRKRGTRMLNVELPGQRRPKRSFMDAMKDDMHRRQEPQRKTQTTQPDGNLRSAMVTPIGINQRGV